MTAPYTVQYLAAYALTAARENKWLAARKALLHLQRDHGPEGVELAMRGWCDTALASMPPASGPVRWVWKDVVSGEVSDNSDDLPPAQRWASRMLAARQALDIHTWEALMDSLPEGQSTEAGACVLALLESAALTLDQNERQEARKATKKTLLGEHRKGVPAGLRAREADTTPENGDHDGRARA